MTEKTKIKKESKKLNVFLITLIYLEKKKLKKKINTKSWLNKLLDNRFDLIRDFGEFQENIPPGKSRKIKRRNPYKNVTLQKKRQLMASTSEKRLKELPTVYTEIPADQRDK